MDMNYPLLTYAETISAHVHESYIYNSIAIHKLL